jgi:hypothetical protein
MKTKNVNILPVTLLTTALLGLMIASGFIVSTATAQSNTTAMNTTTNKTTNTSTSSSSTDPIVVQIDAAIAAIKNGRSDEGRKYLFEAEKLMEGNPSIADAEKRVEAAIKALSDGDSIGSVNQAEEAKKSVA